MNCIQSSELKENSSAYKPFIAPPTNEQQTDLTDIDFAAEAAKLDAMDQSRQLKFLITLVLSQRKTLSQIETKQNLLNEELLNNIVYSMMHKTHNQIMIGFSGDWVTRRKRHERAGWLYLGAKKGSQQLDEKKLKNVIKHAGIKPVPASHEIFLITPELIQLLISYGWVGIEENKSLILTRHPQIALDFNAS